MEYPFGRIGMVIQILLDVQISFSLKKDLQIKEKGATRMRLLMQSIWAGPQDGSKQYITEKAGDIVLIWIMN